MGKRYRIRGGGTGRGGVEGARGGVLDGARGEASFKDPLLASTVKAQQPVTPTLLVPLIAPPPLRLCLHTPLLSRSHWNDKYYEQYHYTDMGIDL